MGSEMCIRDRLKASRGGLQPCSVCHATTHPTHLCPRANAMVGWTQSAPRGLAASPGAPSQTAGMTTGGGFTVGRVGEPEGDGATQQVPATRPRPGVGLSLALPLGSLMID